ncbi:MAG: hypothetical protein AAF805_14695, partial [Planctomycetota bacterium]
GANIPAPGDSDAYLIDVDSSNVGFELARCKISLSDPEPGGMAARSWVYNLDASCVAITPSMGGLSGGSRTDCRHEIAARGVWTPIVFFKELGSGSDVTGQIDLYLRVKEWNGPDGQCRFLILPEQYVGASTGDSRFTAPGYPLGRGVSGPDEQATVTNLGVAGDYTAAVRFGLPLEGFDRHVFPAREHPLVTLYADASNWAKVHWSDDELVLTTSVAGATQTASVAGFELYPHDQLTVAVRRNSSTVTLDAYKGGGPRSSASVSVANTVAPVELRLATDETRTLTESVEVYDVAIETSRLGDADLETLTSWQDEAAMTAEKLDEISAKVDAVAAAIAAQPDAPTAAEVASAAATRVEDTLLQTDKTLLSVSNDSVLGSIDSRTSSIQSVISQRLTSSRADKLDRLPGSGVVATVDDLAALPAAPTPAENAAAVSAELLTGDAGAAYGNESIADHLRGRINAVAGLLSDTETGLAPTRLAAQTAADNTALAWAPRVLTVSGTTLTLQTEANPAGILQAAAGARVLLRDTGTGATETRTLVTLTGPTGIPADDWAATLDQAPTVLTTSSPNWELVLVTATSGGSGGNGPTAAENASATFAALATDAGSIGAGSALDELLAKASAIERETLTELTGAIT